MRLSASGLVVGQLRRLSPKAHVDKVLNQLMKKP